MYSIDRAGGVKSPAPFGSAIPREVPLQWALFFQEKLQLGPPTRNPSNARQDRYRDYNPTPKGIGWPDIAAIRFSAAIVAIWFLACSVAEPICGRIKHCGH